MPRMVITALSWVLAISVGFVIGALACSSKLAARPSQNWEELRMRL